MSATATYTRKQVYDVLAQMSGQKNIVSCPRIFIDLLEGNFGAAVLLNQVIYWSDKASDPDGWFYKSYKDWQEELGLSQYQVIAAVNGDRRKKKVKKPCLKDFGVYSELRKAPNALAGQAVPTLHYRIDKDALIKAVMKRLGYEQSSYPGYEQSQQPGYEQSQQPSGYEQSSQPYITETTTEITQSENLSAGAGESPENGNKRDSTEAPALVGENPEETKPAPPAEIPEVARRRDELFEVICLGSFGKQHQQINAQAGRVAKIKKLLLKDKSDLTPRQLRNGYALYADEMLKSGKDVKRNPVQRVKDPVKILDYVQQAIDAGYDITPPDITAADWYHSAYAALTGRSVPDAMRLPENSIMQALTMSCDDPSIAEWRERVVQHA